MHNTFKKIHDVGLARVDGPIIFSDLVKPIALVTDDFLERTPFKEVIWEGNLLQFADIETISEEECKKAYTYLPIYEITSEMICTTARKGNGLYLGKIGGPLVYKKKQFGIASFGAASGYPDVFIKVSPYVDWINENSR